MSLVALSLEVGAPEPDTAMILSTCLETASISSSLKSVQSNISFEKFQQGQRRNGHTQLNIITVGTGAVNSNEHIIHYTTKGTCCKSLLCSYRPRHITYTCTHLGKSMIVCD